MPLKVTSELNRPLLNCSLKAYFKDRKKEFPAFVTHLSLHVTTVWQHQGSTGLRALGVSPGKSTKSAKALKLI